MRLALAAIFFAICLSWLPGDLAAMEQDGAGSATRPMTAETVTIQKPLSITLECPEQALQLLLTRPLGVSWTPNGFVEGNIPTQKVVEQVIVIMPGADPRYEVAMGEILDILRAVKSGRYIPPDQRQSAQRPQLPGSSGGSQQLYTGGMPLTPPPRFDQSTAAAPGNPASSAQGINLQTQPSPQFGASGQGFGAGDSSTLRSDSTLPGSGISGFPLAPLSGNPADPAGFPGSNNGSTTLGRSSLLQRPLSQMDPPGVGGTGTGSLSGNGGVQPFSSWPASNSIWNQPQPGQTNGGGLQPVAGGPGNTGFPNSPAANPGTGNGISPGSAIAGNSSVWNPAGGNAGTVPASTQDSILQYVQQLGAVVQRQDSSLKELELQNAYLRRENELQRQDTLQQRFASRTGMEFSGIDSTGIQSGGPVRNPWGSDSVSGAAQNGNPGTQADLPAPRSLGVPAEVKGPSPRAGSGTAADANRMFLLWLFLAASLGLNVYLGIVAHGLYMRYGDLADELRETFTTTA